MTDYFATKHTSARDEILYRMAVANWANDSDGDVASPAGYFWRISVAPEELKEISEAFAEDLEELAVAPRDLIGHYLLKEDDQGFVAVEEFTDADYLGAGFTDQQRFFAEWADATGEEQ